MAAILMGLMAFLPLAEFYGIGDAGPEERTLAAFGISGINPEDGNIVLVTGTPVLGVAITAAALLSLIAIFLYKKRGAQYRVCILEIILLAGIQALAVFHVLRTVKGPEALADGIYNPVLTFFFPLICIILVWLAMVGIRKDVRLIKSMDRIR